MTTASSASAQFTVASASPLEDFEALMMRYKYDGDDNDDGDADDDDNHDDDHDYISMYKYINTIYIHLCIYENLKRF
jgi:ABC-type Zn2+ transport system substrate-binding protein/surface adhesin